MSEATSGELPVSCPDCLDRGGRSVAGRWIRCRCTRPTQAAQATLRAANQMDGRQFSLDLFPQEPTEGGETMAKTATRSRNGNGRKSESDYRDEAGWGSAFQRERDSKKQPGFTGQLTLTKQMLREFAELCEDGEVELDVAIWALPWKDKKRLRLHLQAPYQPDESESEDELEADEDEDDIPF